MRRALVILLGLGLAATLPASEESQSQITDHEFQPWRYDDDTVLCKHWDWKYPTRPPCDRPAAEHAQVPEPAEDGGGS